MRFLIDECAGPALAQWLTSQGHVVQSVHDEAPGISDDEILRIAFVEDWIVITADKDFGEKIFRDKKPHHGVVFLRLRDERAMSKITRLRELLDAHADDLPNAFVVVTEGHVRFAQL